eukprot:GHVN01032410.1.p1 GENE.GHVN01032410.1~~GHVN01032410.1.p1  ORF type:complete len:883 (-),score=287.62 GHVN01032410.1:484-3132(-)
MGSSGDVRTPSPSSPNIPHPPRYPCLSLNQEEASQSPHSLHSLQPTHPPQPTRSPQLPRSPQSLHSQQSPHSPQPDETMSGQQRHSPPPGHESPPPIHPRHSPSNQPHANDTPPSPHSPSSLSSSCSLSDPSDLSDRPPKARSTYPFVNESPCRSLVINYALVAGDQDRRKGKDKEKKPRPSASHSHSNSASSSSHSNLSASPPHSNSSSSSSHSNSSASPSHSNSSSSSSHSNSSASPPHSNSSSSPSHSNSSFSPFHPHSSSSPSHSHSSSLSHSHSTSSRHCYHAHHPKLQPFIPSTELLGLKKHALQRPTEKGIENQPCLVPQPSPSPFSSQPANAPQSPSSASSVCRPTRSCLSDEWHEPVGQCSVEEPTRRSVCPVTGGSVQGGGEPNSTLVGGNSEMLRVGGERKMTSPRDGYLSPSVVSPSSSSRNDSLYGDREGGVHSNEVEELQTQHPTSHDQHQSTSTKHRTASLNQQHATSLNQHHTTLPNKHQGDEPQQRGDQAGVRHEPPHHTSTTHHAGSPPQYSQQSEESPQRAVQPRERVNLGDFRVLQLLGKGSYGTVYLVQKITTERVYAMKVLRKDIVISRKQVEHTKTERNVMVAIRHPFIVQLYYSLQTKQKLYFIMEYCPGGELFFHLSRRRIFDEEGCRFYASQILLALAHLHTMNIIYRDLKPENILLDKDGYVKLTDFGLSKEGVSDNVSAHSMCGTPEYIAPEVLENKGHGKAVDWWSLGTLIFELLNGLPAFYSRDRNQLFRNIREGSLAYPPHFSPEARSLLTGLFNRNPNLRLGGGPGDAEEIKAHPFFNGVDWEAMLAKKVKPPVQPSLRSPTDVQNFDHDFITQPVRNSELMHEELSIPPSQDMFSGFAYDAEHVSTSQD